MSEAEEKRPVVSPQELESLLGSQNLVHFSGVDKGFKYRNAFLLLVTLYFVTRLLFFPQQSLKPFNFTSQIGSLSSYIQMRGWYLLAIMFVYVYSYIKDWHFSRVALICASLSFANLLMDFFNIYSFIVGPIPPVIIVGVMLRMGIIYCLFMNSVRDNRAPAMPRTLFS
jgi:hypothetical protein